MKLRDIIKLNELNYPGNMGMMEMFKFHQVATPEQKQLMQELLSQNKIDDAWELLQRVSGMKLQKM